MNKPTLKLEEPRVSMATKSVQHTVSRPETAETGIQTKEANLKDYDREDLLELLKELVITPRQHLDHVMELLEKDLDEPEISYNKMLRHVHSLSVAEVS